MTHHELKIELEFMQEKIDGDKPFEIRFNDRFYKKGDTIKYINSQILTPFAGVYEITYVTSYEQKDNWVVFGDKLIKGY